MSKMNIDPKNKGKFTATQKRTGKSTEELCLSKNRTTSKRANFARMAKRGWKPLKENDEYENELTPFEEYQQDYPNGSFDVSDMTPDELARWCQNVGDFLYVYKGLRGWTIMAANTDSIVEDIVNDIEYCNRIEPTHEIDYLFQSREREFANDYVCIFKIFGTKDGDYYVVYQEDKISGNNFDLNENKIILTNDFDMEKIKLTEDKLREIIAESVRNILLNEGSGNRIQVSRDEILDILNKQDDDPKSGGKWATVTYVKPVSVYKTKKSWRTEDVQKALDNNSNRSEEEWFKNLSAYNQEGAKGKNPISFVVVAKRHLIHWHTQEDFGRESHEYGEALRKLRMRNGIGLESDGYLGDNHNQREKFDYAAQQNQTGNLSRDFNLAKSDKKQLKTMIFFCDDQGNVITELPQDVLNSMLAPYKEKGVEKAVSDVLSGEALEAYAQAKKELDKTYIPVNLLYKQILCIAANVNGQSYYYINDKLETPIAKGGDVNINQQKMIKVAEELLDENFQILDNYAVNNH